MLLLQYNTEKRTSVNNGYDSVPVLCNQNKIWNTDCYPAQEIMLGILPKLWLFLCTRVSLLFDNFDAFKNGLFVICNIM